MSLTLPKTKLHPQKYSFREISNNVKTQIRLITHGGKVAVTLSVKRCRLLSRPFWVRYLRMDPVPLIYTPLQTLLVNWGMMTVLSFSSITHVIFMEFSFETFNVCQYAQWRTTCDLSCSGMLRVGLLHRSPLCSALRELLCDHVWWLLGYFASAHSGHTGKRGDRLVLWDR